MVDNGAILILGETNPGFFHMHVSDFKRVRVEETGPLEGYTRNSHNSASATFYWSKLAVRQTLIQRSRETLSPSGDKLQKHVHMEMGRICHHYFASHYIYPKPYHMKNG